MRLRPSGRQGPVATSIGAFSDYQLNEAWTWEHLALTRARVVAVIPGSVTEDLPPLSLLIEALRHEILTRRGTDPRVMPDFQQMRARIFGAMEESTALARRSGRGRLQDIELFAQTLALRAGSASRRAGMQIRAGLKAGLVGAEDAERLVRAHDFLWRLYCCARLLTERPLDLETIGQGGQEFLLRETGCNDVAALCGRLDRLIEAAGEIIDAQSPEEGCGGHGVTRSCR